jgi:hypothetical protein
MPNPYKRGADRAPSILDWPATFLSTTFGTDVQSRVSKLIVVKKEYGKKIGSAWNKYNLVCFIAAAGWLTVKTFKSFLETTMHPSTRLDPGQRPDFASPMMQAKPDNLPHTTSLGRAPDDDRSGRSPSDTGQHWPEIYWLAITTMLP